jgi:hypothetical protein
MLFGLGIRVIGLISAVFIGCIVAAPIVIMLAVIIGIPVFVITSIRKNTTATKYITTTIVLLLFTIYFCFVELRLMSTPVVLQFFIISLFVIMFAFVYDALADSIKLLEIKKVDEEAYKIECKKRRGFEEFKKQFTKFGVFVGFILVGTAILGVALLIAS